jgi:hypothetical protein
VASRCTQRWHGQGKCFPSAGGYHAKRPPAPSSDACPINPTLRRQPRMPAPSSWFLFFPSSSATTGCRRPRRIPPTAAAPPDPHPPPPRRQIPTHHRRGPRWISTSAASRSLRFSSRHQRSTAATHHCSPSPCDVVVDQREVDRRVSGTSSQRMTLLDDGGAMSRCFKRKSEQQHRHVRGAGLAPPMSQRLSWLCSCGAVSSGRADTSMSVPLGSLLSQQ